MRKVYISGLGGTVGGYMAFSFAAVTKAKAFKACFFLSVADQCTMPLFTPKQLWSLQNTYSGLFFTHNDYGTIKRKTPA